jgi:hypothetical protein
LLIASFLLDQNLLPIKISDAFAGHLPPPADQLEGLRHSPSRKILFTIQVEWFVVKLFDSMYNGITIYHLHAMLASFPAGAEGFSASSRRANRFDFLAFSVRFRAALCATLRASVATNLVS